MCYGVVAVSVSLHSATVDYEEKIIIKKSRSKKMVVAVAVMLVRGVVRICWAVIHFQQVIILSM